MTIFIITHCIIMSYKTYISQSIFGLKPFIYSGFALKFAKVEDIGKVEDMNNMKKMIGAALVVLSIWTSSAFGETGGSVNIFFGAKSLDSADWAPVEEQMEVGVKFDIGEKGKNWKFAFDILSSDTTDSSLGIDVTGSTSEMNIGARYYSDPSGQGAFFGVGLSFIDVEMEIAGFGSNSASGTGVWFELGASMKAADNLNLGIDMIISQATIDWLGIEVEGGGTHFGFFAGFSF